MCGIAGYMGFTPLPMENVQTALKMLRHRGPDMDGIVGWTVAERFVPLDETSTLPWRRVFLHTRLSIVDLSLAGRQPMTDRSGRWIVFNGEIYNHVEIRNELNKLGHPFNTRTDTEVVLAAYDEWGPSCVEHFNGMWAFAIYDPANNCLFCSRDRLGVKPFYFVLSEDGGLGFASEIPALLSLLGLPSQIDPVKLAGYFLYSRIDDSNETLYKGVRELRGGFNGFYDLINRKWKEERYWSLPEKEDFLGSYEQAVDRFAELLEDSVRLRLRADVPMALLLSGGIDSSAIALAASRVGANIVAFTSHFPDFPKIDETHFAKIVADCTGMRHELVVPDLTRVLAEEPLLTRAQAAPFGSLSLYVHWAIMAKVREKGIPVVLSGQGGDEMFFGYERYYVSHWRSLWPDTGAMVKAWADMSKHSRLGYATSLKFLAYFGLEGIQWRRWRRRAEQALNSTLIEKAPPPPNRMPTDRRMLQQAELVDDNLTQLLRYDDRTSSAHSMETRLPFLDYRLVEFAHRLPWHYSIREGWTKHLIRSYIDRFGLSDVAWRTHKLGLDAPTEEWLRGLCATRWNDLKCTPFAQQIIRPGIEMETLAMQTRWDVYNVCHMASLLDWQLHK